jgi:hypothetical protein
MKSAKEILEWYDTDPDPMSMCHSRDITSRMLLEAIAHLEDKIDSIQSAMTVNAIPPSWFTASTSVSSGGEEG